jgi:hypothetical protein
MLAHIAPAPFDVVGPQRFRIMDEGRLDAAGDVRPIDGEHGLDIAVVRGANCQWNGIDDHGLS